MRLDIELPKGSTRCFHLTESFLIVEQRHDLGSYDDYVRYCSRPLYYTEILLNCTEAQLSLFVYEYIVNSSVLFTSKAEKPKRFCTFTETIENYVNFYPMFLAEDLGHWLIVCD